MRRTEQRRELETRMAEQSEESSLGAAPAALRPPRAEARALRFPS
jgi:hypothetical protein